jgi:hypothetical protein
LTEATDVQAYEDPMILDQYVGVGIDRISARLSELVEMSLDGRQKRLPHLGENSFVGFE